MNENDFFSSSDFPLCATLVALGFAVEATDHTNQHRCEFLFARSKEVEQVVQGFYAGTIRIEPKKFFYATRELKQLLYNR